MADHQNMLPECVEAITTIKGALVSIHEDVVEVKDGQKCMDRKLFGDGTAENPGLIGRIDRLEQSAQRAKWWSSAAILTALGAAGNAFADWMKR